jgi:hypothetical protein
MPEKFYVKVNFQPLKKYRNLELENLNAGIQTKH